MRHFIAFLFLIVLCACSAPPSSYKHVSGKGLPKAAADRDPVRRIVMTYDKAHEKIDVVYFHDGHYDASAMRKIENIMRDRHNGFRGSIDPELVDYMVDLRKRMGLPASIPFQILSGYRSPETNGKLSKNNSNVAKESHHLRGWAVDFRIKNVDGRAIAEIAKTMQRGGVAYYPSDNHLHVDIGNIRTWQDKNR